jgi:N-acyl homoserine lactone hydrolase
MPRFFQALAALAVCITVSSASAQRSDEDIRLYVFDCGHAEFRDLGVASDTGELDGRPGVLADPCFLVRHPKGWLLWDAGLPPAGELESIGPQAALEQAGVRFTPPMPLSQQLKVIGLVPQQVNYLAFSHLHFDHVGNANQFPASTWLLNRRELAWATSEPSPVSMRPVLFVAYRQAKVQLLEGDHDVFGDGRVRILHTPGHTPGSSVLLLNLRRSGPLLLSGDLYLSGEGKRHGYVPSVNASRADTLASMARVDRLLKQLKAKLIVQHDVAEFASMPRAPAYLD